MQTNIKALQKHRLYSLEFKAQLVSDFESGKYSVQQLSKLHKIGRPTIYKWIYKFSTFNEHGSRIVEMSKSSTHKLEDLEKKIKDLERIVGQKQIKIDYLEKMVDIAKEELDIDLKKNFDTSQSAGSDKTKKK